MTLLFLSPIAFALALSSSHAFQPLHPRVRPATHLNAQSNDSLKFFLTGAKPKAPVYSSEPVTNPLSSSQPGITEFQPETLPDMESDSLIPDAVYTSAVENAARTTEAVQQATEDFKSGLGAAAQSIDTEAFVKQSQEMAQSFRDSLHSMQNQFTAASDYPGLEYSPQTVQKMAQNLRDSFQSLAGDSSASDGNAPLLWEYVNNNLQKVNIPKLEPALQGAITFPQAALQETMKQLSELSTQPNWQMQQYLDVLNKEELKTWYWTAFFTLIALGYLPALQNFRIFGDSTAPELSSLVKELNEMKSEKEVRDRDLEEVRTEMKLFLDTVQGGRALEAELAEELQLAKETNAAQAKQIEILQGENELLREQVKQLTVAVSDLKESLDAITSMKEELSESMHAAPMEVAVSQPSAPAPKKSPVTAKKSTAQAFKEVAKEPASEVTEEETKPKKAAAQKKAITTTKKAPKKADAAKSKPTSVEIVNNNGEDWSSLTVSTLNRKTIKDLMEYLEAKGATAVDSDGKPLKKAELVDAVMSVKA
ncbi:hypothetical protein FisN_24Lh098 [Fistulifera solaris]|uniref:Uncharacterized protein n=1 Tax=Fistulifera solaris TaxID=1519565 RepID=A0A1Z5K9E6_FISSO|nr:hypothetical protein FisN_24Lh098 [Fistulifera solaris]|eukprot:GAX22816.1 hypothetical protein FisN_24Lh098 [Fistulifera solaris]